MALIAPPGFLGIIRLPAHRNIFVAIGDLGHHGTGDAGLRLRDQALQFRRARGKVFAFGLKLLALIKVVFGRIGERGRHAVAHVGATAEPAAERQQRHDRCGAPHHVGTGKRSNHMTLVSRQH